MQVLAFEVMGLLGREGRIRGDLKSDLNILTGRNGAGKTTILKLIWYVMSGNILLALKEINFQKFTLHTDIYECSVFNLGRTICRVEITIDGNTKVYEDIEDVDGDIYSSAEEQADAVLQELGSSVFFPTFRRIEGGFTLGSPRANALSSRGSRGKNDVEDALILLSRKLTNEPHVFVSAISTVDIVGLLLRQFADLSESSNALQQTASQQIIEKIKAYKSDSADSDQIDAANSVLDSIRSEIEAMEQERERVMAPIEAVRALVERLFLHTGIQFGPRLNFGDAAGAVNSDALSAGEKQMLSFIFYNGFYRDSVIFIDEPELSLHVDWQRQLFSILRNQHTSNQFIIATHSPFIYGKFPDKEILISPDRGDGNVDA